MVFEDGEQRSNFVHVDDVARAFMLAHEHQQAAGQVFNIASGHEVSILAAGAALADAMGVLHLTPEVLGRACVFDALVFASTYKIYGTLADIPFARDGDANVPTDPALRAAGIDEARPSSSTHPMATARVPPTSMCSTMPAASVCLPACCA